MISYAAAVWIGYAVAVAVAATRGRAFAGFTAVVLLFPAAVGLALRSQLGVFGLAFPYLYGAALVHMVLLARWPRMWPWPVRLAVSWPALYFAAACVLALPWALAAAAGLSPRGAGLPFALAALGVLQSAGGREEVVDLWLRSGIDAGPLRRFREGLRGEASPDRRPFTVVQITDPHLGPFMSVARLRQICARAVAREPDLVLVTGDLMTMESRSVDVVAEALAPLQALPGRVFACHGNHDHEAREVVAQAYARCGVTLLVDEAVAVETAAGRVQIVGLDFRWRERAEHLRSVCGAHPRVPGALRLLLLHDPGAFAHLEAGEGDLVLSGHTHGGQVGLVSLGLPYTFLSLVPRLPDHGPWARGLDRLYVHRAQGHYGFPIRLGVPSEHSLLRVWR